MFCDRIYNDAVLRTELNSWEHLTQNITIKGTDKNKREGNLACTKMTNIENSNCCNYNIESKRVIEKKMAKSNL